YPPQAGQPGSIGSDEYAEFRGQFPRGSLNFTRGTYVELELQGGPSACVQIDYWDPQITCADQYCSDLNGDHNVTIRDFQLLLAEYGTATPLSDPNSGQSRNCLDAQISQDGFVDIVDLTAWDAILAKSPPTNFCTPAPVASPVGQALGSYSGSLLIAG